MIEAEEATELLGHWQATLRQWAPPGSRATVIREGHAAFTALIADVPQSEHDAAWKDVEQALKRLEGKDGFAGPNDMNLVVGRKPIR